MYYREEIIDGALCYKISPDGKWTPLSVKELTNRIVELQAQINKLRV